MDDVYERVSLSDSGGVFLALFLVGRGNLVGWMPNFSSGQGMSRIVLRSHAALRFIRPLIKNRESMEFTNQSLNFRGFNDKLV